MKFSIKDFFSKCDQIYRKPRIWPHLLKKTLMENFIFCAVWCKIIKDKILKMDNGYIGKNSYFEEPENFFKNQLSSLVPSF